MHGPMLHAVEVEADAAAAYRALTTRDGLAAFWTPDTEAEARLGSVARFGFAGAPVDLRMRVDELREGRAVGWTCLGDFPWWAGTSVLWELMPVTERPGTTLLFRHAGWPTDYPELEYAKVNYTWARIVGALKAYLGSGQPGPFLS